ncbi:aspartic proteinase Asp1-like [Tripterygium wilfordii]|uniref:aspartic proteinase Asp1-like n=1 Tax=Tripterygium wilfordii TaxID=458696 RepID=UPI0018F85DFC|nr:aspartic proteinase Asp1-like [Tripterygium wilfordii]
MEDKTHNPLPPMMMIVVLSFQGFLSEANHSVISIGKSGITSNLMETSSIILPLTGSFYSKGGYFTTINISNPAMPFELLIDTGSTLSWVKCEEPCEDCIPPKPSGLLYKPPKDSIVPCQDRLCAAIQGDKHNCSNPLERCDYVEKYFDGSSTQVLLDSKMPIAVKNSDRLTSKILSALSLSIVVNTLGPHDIVLHGLYHLMVLRPKKNALLEMGDFALSHNNILHAWVPVHCEYIGLSSWCGYKQIGHFPGDGIIGLSRNSASLLSQIHEQGLVKKVIGHCFNGNGAIHYRTTASPCLRVFEFSGGGSIQPSGLCSTITSFMKQNIATHLESQIVKVESQTAAAGPQMVFDSRQQRIRGEMMQYVSAPVDLSFEGSETQIDHVLKGKPLEPAQPETELPICWKQSNRKPISSFEKIRDYFKNWTLHFPNDELNVKLDLPLQAYLGKVCLGILDDSKLVNMNIIGAISMQDKLVMYDSINRRIGWASRECNMPIVA